MLYILQFDRYISPLLALRTWHGFVGEEEQTPSWKLLFKEADSESLTT